MKYPVGVRILSYLAFLLPCLFVFLEVAVADAGHGSEQQGRQKTDKSFREGEILVKFSSDVKPSETTKVHNKYGSKRMGNLRQGHLERVFIAPGLTVEDAVSFYNAEPAVEYAEPNYTVSINALPDDPDFPSLWNLDDTGQWNGVVKADIGTAKAWDITTGSRDVVVAIVDSGVDYNHSDLAANIWENTAEKNGIPGFDDDGNGYIDDIHGIDTFNHDSDPFDDNGHGTHVAGTVGAVGNNGIGIAGVNWNVQIMPCKFIGASGKGDIAGAVECLDYISMMKDMGVNVVATNNSWGELPKAPQSLYDAIYGQMDILFVAAAGNLASRDLAIYPSGYYLPNVISVAATDWEDRMAGFSNYGKRTVHVGAPGNPIYSTFRNNTYSWLFGTSMAAPHVTGLAALIRSYYAEADWRATKNLIFAGGDDTPAMLGKTVSGKRINAYGSLVCEDEPVFSVLKFPADNSSDRIGEPQTLAALSINCAEAVGPVSVDGTGGVSVELFDDGIPPDIEAGDGIFSAEWVPESKFADLVFASPTGEETIEAALPAIFTDALSGAVMGEYYEAVVEVQGGTGPYTWAIASGSLPEGLELLSDSGRIVGTPLSAGSEFTLLVTDSRLGQATETFFLNVNTIEILEAIYLRNDKTLEVVAGSLYGPDAYLGIEGYGPMTFDEAKQVWKVEVPDLKKWELPESVTVYGPEGIMTALVDDKWSK